MLGELIRLHVEENNCLIESFECVGTVGGRVLELIGFGSLLSAQDRLPAAARTAAMR